MQKTIEWIEKSKLWKDILGDNYILSEIERNEITSVIDLVYDSNPYSKIKILANFVKYKVSNYKDRLLELLKNPRNISLKFFILRFGEIDGKLRYNKYRATLSNVRSKEYFIEQYGETEGVEKFNKIQNKKLMSLDGFIERCGSELGTKKHLDFCNRNKGNWSLDRQIEMYGELGGKQNYLKIKENVKKVQSLAGFIEQHGIIDGTNIWKKRMDKIWYSSSEESFKERFGDNYQEIMKFQKDHTSLKSFITRYGEDIGTIKYKEFCNKVGITLERMISKYGDIEGRKKFTIWKEKTVSVFCSPISQKLFWDIYNNLNNNLKEKTYFSKLNMEFIKADTGYCYCYDFVISSIKLAFEFNGNIFHANPKMYKNTDCPNPFYKELTAQEIWDFDAKKKEKLESFGFKLFEIWEDEYRKEPDLILQDCILKIKERENEFNN